MRRWMTCLLMASLCVATSADAVASGPFRYLWERRKAELYAQLSRDVTRKVNVRVEAAKKDLEDSLSARVTAEAAKLQEQAKADVAELENLFDKEFDELDTRVDKKVAELDERFSKEQRDIDADIAAVSKKLSEGTGEKQKESQAKLEAELRRIEKDSTAEVEKLLAATGKRIDGEMAKLDSEMAKLKTRLDDQFAALSKRLEAEAAEAKKAAKEAKEASEAKEARREEPAAAKPEPNANQEPGSTSAPSGEEK